MPVLSYVERERLVRSLLGEYVWVMDLFEDEVIIESYTEKITIEGNELEAGSLYRWRYSIDDKGQCQLVGKPDPVMRKVSYQKVKYSAVFAKVGEDQEWVYREGKVWELACYSDKIVVSEDELEHAITNFRPVPINLEHEQTPLDGKLGVWEKVWRVGKDVMGRLRIPKWLDELFKGEGLKTSVEFTPNRLFKGIALCNDPRVEDAAIFAAFTEHHKGLRIEKSEPLNNEVKMNWFQKFSEWYSTGKWPTDPSKELKEAGFDAAAAAAQFSAAPPPPTTSIATPTEETAEAKALREQMEAQNSAYSQQIQAAEAINLSSAAKTFCDGYVAKKKMLPAETEGMRGLFEQAVRHDAAQAKSGCFKADGTVLEGTSVAVLKKMLDDRPEFFMTTESLRADPNGGAGTAMSAERKANLLGMGSIRVETKGA